MNYLELELAARQLTAEEVEAGVRSLAREPRFAAVVRLLLDVEQEAGDGAMQLGTANNLGALARAAGARFAVRELLGRVKEALEPARRRGAQRPEE